MKINKNGEIDLEIPSIEDIAQEYYKKVQYRWEEINVENAPTEKLLNARKIIDKELKRRENRWNQNKKYKIKCV